MFFAVLLNLLLFFEQAKDLPSLYIDQAIVEDTRAPQKISNQNVGVKISAQHAIAIDRESKKILFEKEANQPVSIASITKLMTALVLLDTNPDWEQDFSVIEQDKREGGIIYSAPGMELTLDDLWHNLLIASDNTAAVALVRSTGMDLSQFVVLMNNKAAELGMSQTHFVEVTGLNDSNVSSARDLAVLLDTALKQPKIKQAVTTEARLFTNQANGISYWANSTDKLLGSFLNKGDYSIEGAKTGYIIEAGYCFAVDVSKNDHEVIGVVLGSDTEEDRFLDAKGMIYWVFENYQWKN